LVAFPGFFTVGEQANFGVADFQDVLRIQAAHQGKLEEKVGAAVRIGADIQHHAESSLGREERGQPGTLHSINPPQGAQRIEHHSAGVPGRDKCLAAAAFDQFEPHCHGIIRFLGGPGDCFIFHFQHVRSVLDDHR